MFADYITQNIVNSCDNSAFYRAVFEIKRPTCANGYFLPANAINCESCPSGFTCNGGTYTFNENESQGAIYSSTITNDMNNICAVNGPQFLRAVFTPKTINCPAGKYLSANSIICNTDCTADHYCPGGEYFFNETENGGIFSCPVEHPFAPAGMWLASQCGRKLHIGDDVLYLHQSPSSPTTHRLFIQYGNTVYSANTALKQNGVDDPKISAGANQSLHVTIDGIEYLVHDDSVE